MRRKEREAGGRVCRCGGPGHQDSNQTPGEKAEEMYFCFPKESGDDIFQELCFFLSCDIREILLSMPDICFSYCNSSAICIYPLED